MQRSGGHQGLSNRATAQQVGKQVVIAIPVTMLIQRHQEYLMRLQETQDLGTVMGFADGIAQLAAKALLRCGVVEK